MIPNGCQPAVFCSVERKDLEVRWRLAVMEHHHAWRAAHVVDVSVPQYRYRRAQAVVIYSCFDRSMFGLLALSRALSSGT
jgi:hypothetical protein